MCTLYIYACYIYSRFLTDYFLFIDKEEKKITVIFESLENGGLTVEIFTLKRIHGWSGVIPCLTGKRFHEQNIDLCVNASTKVSLYLRILHFISLNWTGLQAEPLITHIMIYLIIDNKTQYSFVHFFLK